MFYEILGDVRISTEGQPVRLPGGITLTVLGALLINANREMSKESLIRAVWGDEGATEAQLHKRIREVRVLLGPLERDGDLHTLNRFGYRMQLGPEQLDKLRFEQLVVDADTARTERRVDDEIGQLHKALGLWRGPHPLANVDTTYFHGEVEALENRRRRVAARLAELELGRRGHDRVVAVLSPICTAYPTDRKLCQLLMYAQHLDGDSAGALTVYRRYADELDKETGGRPDPSLRELYYAIAAGDEERIAATSPVPRLGGAAMRTGTVVPRQLPPDEWIVGRDSITADISRILSREQRHAAPVIVISGSGGIGKTALAVRASYAAIASYPDGQLYAVLQDTAGNPVDSGEVLAQFLRALGAQRIPESKQERSTLYRTLTADRRVLVVLDNAADGTQVADLIPAGPGCAVVVTAARRLPDVTGAHHVPPLEPLSHADAVEIFRKVATNSNVDLGEDAESIDRVVRLCGGLPLALRIAGSLRAHDHPRSTADLAKRLDSQGLSAFEYGELSVARTIGAGFDHLDAGTRRLFLGLGLLRLPTFAQWTATALLDGSGVDSVAALSRLSASFMVAATDTEPRYRFHDLTRQWSDRWARIEYADDPNALPALVYRGLLTLARYAHLSVYGSEFDVIHSSVAGWAAPADELAAVAEARWDWFERERPNIRAAIEHCAALGLTEICWDLAVTAHEFYTVRGYFDDWYATHIAALRACQEAGDRRGEGIMLACLGQPALVASRRGGAVSGPAELERAVALLTECGDRHGLAIAQRTLANALRRHGHLTRPLELFREAQQNYVASDDAAGGWQALRFIGQTHLDRGDYPQARRVLDQAVVDAAQLDERLLAQAHYWAGLASLATGDLDAAETLFDAVFEVFRDDANVGHAYAAHGLGELARLRGRYRDAERHLTIAVQLAHTGADAALEGRIWLSMAALDRAQNLPGEQIAALEQAIALFAAGDTAYLEVRALAALGTARVEQDAMDAADAAWSRVELLYDTAGVPGEDRLYRRPER